MPPVKPSRDPRAKEGGEDEALLTPEMIDLPLIDEVSLAGTVGPGSRQIVVLKEEMRGG